MSPVLLAVAPIFLLVLVGHGLSRLHFPSEEFWPVSERLTYYVLFPALLIQGLAGRSMDSHALPLVLGLLGSVLAVSILLWISFRWLGLNGPAFTSVFQGAIRPNTYVGMSVAAALLGPDWMAPTAVALLTLIPLVNVLCVVTLTRHGDNGAHGVLGVVRELAKNPLLLACVVGLAINGLSIELPEALDEMLAILGRAALPMGLLAVGAGLRFSGLGREIKPMLLSGAAHLVVLPALASGLVTLLHGTPQARLTAVIYTAIPVAVSAFILARQMGGDHQLMARIITAQTALSALTLPLAILFLG